MLSFSQLLPSSFAASSFYCFYFKECEIEYISLACLLSPRRTVAGAVAALGRRALPCQEVISPVSIFILIPRLFSSLFPFFLSLPLLVCLLLFPESLLGGRFFNRSLLLLLLPRQILKQVLANESRQKRFANILQRICYKKCWNFDLFDHNTNFLLMKW